MERACIHSLFTIKTVKCPPSYIMTNALRRATGNMEESGALLMGCWREILGELSRMEEGASGWIIGSPRGLGPPERECKRWVHGLGIGFVK